MKERPISFNGEMMRAILDGRKTQTRGMVKFDVSGRIKLGRKSWHIDDKNCGMACPHGQVGDHLWARESFQCAPQKRCYCSQGASPVPCDDWVNGTGCATDSEGVVYKADERTSTRWIPPIQMPRWASRITLEITDVRVQRLQGISEEDAQAEGFMPIRMCANPNGTGEFTISARSKFIDNWDSLYLKKGYGWKENPWIWAISFKVI